jgi:hypothetical protein
MSNAAAKAVFLSYASQDAEPARRVCEALRAAGIEVWFDQSELRGGDAWDGKIRLQIKACTLFVPIISAHTQERLEGYFRREWRVAVDRMHDMDDDMPFLVPVVIDDMSDADARVPERFRERQWMRLPGGEANPAFVERVRILLAAEGGRGRSMAPFPPAGGGPADPGDPAGRARRRWRPLIPVAGVILGAAVAFALWPGRKSGKAAPAESGAPVVAPAVPMTEARQLVERARAITLAGSLTRAQLDAAGELCDRALRLDSTDAAVWTEAARTDLLLIYPYGYDRSAERRQRAQFRAARAINLDPGLYGARVVQAAVFAHAVETPALLGEAEKMFRELSGSHPDDRDLVVQLAEVLREQRRFAEAATLFEQVGEFEVAGWSYYIGGNTRAALAAVNRGLRDRRAVTALQLKSILQVDADEDLDAAQATLDQLQPSELLAELPAAGALRVALYRRDPERVRQIARALPADYMSSNAFRGPRQYFTGLAEEAAGRPGSAEAEWRAGLAVVQERLKSAPDDRELLLWAAWLQAALGDAREAERLLGRAQDVAGLGGDTVDESNAKVFLRLGRKEAVLAWLTAVLRAKAPMWENAHAEARFAPAYDPLRGDPRFKKLLRDTLPMGAKPFDEREPVVNAAPEPKR